MFWMPNYHFQNYGNNRNRNGNFIQRKKKNYTHTHCPIGVIKYNWAQQNTTPSDPFVRHLFISNCTVYGYTCIVYTGANSGFHQKMSKKKYLVVLFMCARIFRASETITVNHVQSVNTKTSKQINGNARKKTENGRGKMIWIFF